jgi:hypothetical protein
MNARAQSILESSKSTDGSGATAAPRRNFQLPSTNYQGTSNRQLPTALQVSSAEAAGPVLGWPCVGVGACDMNLASRGWRSPDDAPTPSATPAGRTLGMFYPA